MDSKRYLSLTVQDDAFASKKMAFVSGPRQVGKTTMGKSLLDSTHNYFSWDQTAFRKAWARSPEASIEARGAGPILIDELHKNRKWKTHLKGLYDTVGDNTSILVTGSARLDIYRKGGDSLLGRYIPYRLHPFSVGECASPPGPDDILKKQSASFRWNDLVNLGGFPEPLLKASAASAQRWSRLRLDRLAFEDTRDFTRIADINSFRLLLDLIPEKVGSLFSMNSLREDVGVAYATLRSWVLLSEILYYGFFVRPYTKNIKRSLKAEPKFYLFDILQIPLTSRGPRLENLAALHLLKSCQFWTDSAQGLFDLHFVRDKEKREVDFLVTREKRPWMLVECKSNSKTPAKNLIHFTGVLKPKYSIQLVDDPKYDRAYPQLGVRVLGYEKFFAGMV